uniref:50S ribosomal protein L19, chloroplastic n=1 Tax=Karlodinium veneficum TaxID=407301 RepID=G1E751_KARVE|nr:ribosomal protein L19 [Karlodinium veneficum]
MTKYTRYLKEIHFNRKNNRNLGNLGIGDFVKITQLRESSIEYLYIIYSKKQIPTQLNFRDNTLDNLKKWNIILNMIQNIKEYNKLHRTPILPIQIKFSQNLIKTFEGNIIAIKHLTIPIFFEQQTNIKFNLSLLGSKSFWKTFYTIKVRNIIKKVGVEKTFLIDSPWILSFDILKKSYIKRSKLYYLRRQPNRKLKKRRQ